MNEVGDIESEWTMFNSSIVESAAMNCGRKNVGASHGSNPRMRCWTAVGRKAIKMERRGMLEPEGLQNLLNQLEKQNPRHERSLDRPQKKDVLASLSASEGEDKPYTSSARQVQGGVDL